MALENPVCEEIWRDRYAKNGETYDDSLRRVAKACASTPSEENDFLEIMRAGKFFPAGRTMSNAGLGHDLTLNNCFAAETKVLTRRGYINIEDVTIGDMVITEDNSWQEVENVMVREFSGDMVKLKGKSLYDDILCTPNHQFLTQHGWVRADRLMIDSSRAVSIDRLRVPTVECNKKYEIIDLTQHFECTDTARIGYTDDGKIYIERKCARNKFSSTVAWSKQTRCINRYLTFTPELRYLIGRWIGDGSITRYKGKRNPAIIQIVFNATKERDAAIRCKQIGDEAFGIISEWRETNQNVISIRWSNEILGTFFLHEFGEKCDRKHLENKYLGDMEIARGLIDADGFIDTHGGGRIVLKNHQLIDWLRETLFLNGYNTFEIYKIRRQKNTYGLSWSSSIGNKGLNQSLMKTYHDKEHNKVTNNPNVLDYIAINSIEFVPVQNLPVYNLSIKNVHSYVVNGVVCHNCFIAPPVLDDFDDIFPKVYLGAKTHQRGGGIGYEFSHIRPRGTPTSNDAVASGPVSFMDVFNAQTATVNQGSRRGANMGILSVYHPDILEFVHAKAEDRERLKYFNLSVMVDDKFMDAVEKDESVYLRWPVYDGEGAYAESTDWKIRKLVSAREIWDEIMRSAYDNGEPGIFFYDNLNKDNNIWYKERIVCTNPCSEYLAGAVYGREPDTGRMLDPQKYGGACNLGSLFLHNFVVHPFTDHAFLDTEELKRAIHIAVRMLDNIIDINKFPNQIFENYQKSFRTIGLGVTGLADALAMLGIKYNSEKGRNCVNDIMQFISANAFEASSDLAEEKGNFPFYDAEQYLTGGFIKRHKCIQSWDRVVEKIARQGIRNAKIMSIAPTGTLSLSFGNNCSSGIEPIFCLEYDRKVHIGGQEDDNIQTVHMEDYAYHMWKKLGSPQKFKDIFVTALEMDVNDHIDMLGVIAGHVDMSVSKTINVPADYTFEQVKDIYKKAWRLGIKGCTIFRPNEIRQGVLISGQDTTEKHQLQRGDIIRCRDMLPGVKKKLITGCGTMHLHAYYDPADGNILETFVSRGSTGGCEKNQEAVSRLMSLSLRGGISLDSVIDQLMSCSGCSAYRTRSITKRDTSIGNSCPTAMAYALRELQEEIQQILKNEQTHCSTAGIEDTPISDLNTGPAQAKCPECGGSLRHEGGCNVCPACGWSKCS